MELRVDQRTHTSTFYSPIPEVPLVKHYRYLGIQIQDDLKMTLDNKERDGKKMNL